MSEQPTLDQHPAHRVTEDPEQHIGPVIKDPWDDDEQTDWPNETVDIGSGRVI